MIKVGIVGVGHLGEIHLKLILSSIYFDLIGFYETNQEKSDLISIILLVKLDMSKDLMGLLLRWKIF